MKSKSDLWHIQIFIILFNQEASNTNLTIYIWRNLEMFNTTPVFQEVLLFLYSFLMERILWLVEFPCSNIQPICHFLERCWYVGMCWRFFLPLSLAGPFIALMSSGDFSWWWREVSQKCIESFLRSSQASKSRDFSMCPHVHCWSGKKCSSCKSRVIWALLYQEKFLYCKYFILSRRILLP